MLRWVTRTPARLTALGFVLASFVGAGLLSLPSVTHLDHRLSFLDTLFMSVSAVCVTGLTVTNVAETFTPFGQTLILGLIQIGGTGIMVVSSAIILASGQRLDMRARTALAEAVDAPSVSSLRDTLVSILGFTAVIELAGTVVLYLAFLGRDDIESPLFAAVFHAVSAFCNAGFSTFRQGLEPFAGSMLVSLTVGSIIILGGIGFPVLRELAGHANSLLRRRRPDRLSLHAKVSLTMSFGLVAVGAVVFILLEGFSGPAKPLSQQLSVGLFQSITARTAGFNTVDIGTLSAPTLMLIALLMFVGASPGSTGGGIRTTTLAVLFASLGSDLAGRTETELAGRRLPFMVVRRALAVFFISVALAAMAMFLLLITEAGRADHIAFEAISAFATVGLSAGTTADLTTSGKVIIIVTMLIGRLGPLTAAVALTDARPPTAVKLPQEGVLIG